MATIPVYTPQVSPQELSGARESSIASPGLFDAGAHQNQQLGQAVEGLGANLADIQVDMQHRQNADMVFRAETAVKTDYTKNFLTPALQRRGAAAEGLADEATKYWDNQLEAHSKNLQNSVQQHIFGEQVAKLRLQSLQQMSLHEAQQKYVSLNESADASVVSSTNLAAQQVGTPIQDAAISQARSDIIRRRAAQAQLNGWTADVANEKTQASLSNLHLQVIQNMVRANPTEAEEYYNKVKLTGDWNGTHNDAAEKLIASGNYLVGAQHAADLAMASSNENGPLNEAQAIEQVMSTTHGKTQRAAVTEVAAAFGRQRQAKAEAMRDSDNTGLKIWNATLKQSAIPADVWTNMSGEGQQAVIKLAEKNAKEEKVVTKWDVYAAVREFARSDPETFRDTTKTQLAVRYADDLAPAQLHDLIDLQTKPTEPGAETVHAQLENAHQRLGWTASSNLKDIGEFDWVAHRALHDYAAVNGKKPDDKKQQEIIDALARDRALKRAYWFDKKEPGYKAYGSADWENSQQVPDEQHDYINARSALIAAGATHPTDEQIKATVAAAYAGKKPKPEGYGTVLRNTAPEAPVSHADQVPGQTAAPTTSLPAEPVAPPVIGNDVHIGREAYDTGKRPDPKVDISPIIQDRLNPMNEATVKPYIKDTAPTIVKDLPTAPAVVPKSIPKAEADRLRHEITHFSAIAKSAAHSEAERARALTEYVKRALRLGITRDAIEKATRRPIESFNLQ